MEKETVETVETVEFANITRKWTKRLFKFSIKEILDKKNNILNTIREVESGYGRKLVEEESELVFYKQGAQITTSSKNDEEIKKIVYINGFKLEKFTYTFRTEDGSLKGRIKYENGPIGISDIFQSEYPSIAENILLKLEFVGSKKQLPEYIELYNNLKKHGKF